MTTPKSNLYQTLAAKENVRIVVMRYRFIGDTVLLIPFLRNLRQALPNAVIDVVTAPDSDALLTHCDDINNRIIYDRKQTSLWAMATTLKKNNYDCAFVLKRSFSSALMAFLAGIPVRVGFNTEFRKILLTHPVRYSMASHELETFMDVLSETGFPVQDKKLQALTRDSKKISKQESSSNIQALLHLTSSNPAKQWPKTQYSEFTRALLETYPDLTLVAVGAPDDKPLYEDLLADLPKSYQGRLVNQCGLPLLDSWTLMGELDFAVGVDSGTMHMMAAHHKPVVTLFGPMSETKWAPMSENLLTTTVTADVQCRPCHLKIKCPYQFQCMTEITPQLVLDKVEPIMQSLKAVRQA